MIGISGCLGGLFCRYDGQTQALLELQTLVQEQKALLICPEVLGGLPIPRNPAEIIGGDGFAVWQNQAKVIDNGDNDVTEAFKEGAICAYQKLQAMGITKLILKERSPSCGSSQIYDGTFSGQKVSGVGVASAYFLMQGITIFSENNWQDALGE
ncbi:MAG: DUF523 domain-containing protein [Enterococcus sp.]